MVRKSLRAQQILAFTLLIVLVYGGLTFYLIRKLNNAFISSAQIYLLREAETLATIPYTTDRFDGISSEYEHFLIDVSAIIQSRITLIDPSGKVIFDTDTDPKLMDNHIDRPEILSASKGVSAIQIRTSRTLGIEMIYAAAPIFEPSGGEIRAILRLAVPLSDLRNSINPVITILVIAAGLSAMIMIIMVIVLSELFLRPVQTLTNSIKNIHNDNLADILNTPPSHRKDEIGQLDIAFREMACLLSEQIVQLRKEQSTLSAVLSRMTDALIIANPDGGIVMMNPAAAIIFGLEYPDTAGLTLMKVVRHHGIVELWQKSRQLLDQQSSTYELEPARYYLQVTVTPLEPTMPGLSLIVFQDLSRIRQLENVRRDFVSNVSHELRTPLASLKALSETLMEGALDDPDVARRFLGQMENEIDTLTQLVRELLELSRIESGRVPLVIKPISPWELINPAVERMLIQASRSGLKLGMICSKDLPLVLADAERIEQVLVNLIHNAIKFTPSGGSIIVSASHEGSLVNFSVRDNGVGIKPGDLPRIFERFYKADKARSGGGTGLGLSIARHIIESHSGSIWVESQPGSGSTFFFTIPISNQ